MASGELEYVGVGGELYLHGHGESSSILGVHVTSLRPALLLCKSLHLCTVSNLNKLIKFLRVNFGGLLGPKEEDRRRLLFP